MVVLISVVVGVPAFPDAPVTRYVQIAEMEGVPYRDAEIEYAPGELVVGQVVGALGIDGGRALLAIIAFGGDVAAFALLSRAWGERASFRYLLLGTPLLIFMYRRIDLVVVALAVAAVTGTPRRREGVRGFAAAVAILTRVWPIVVVPVLLIERRWKRATVAVIALALGVVVWIGVGGVDGVRQVTTYRGATGWEVESTVGVIVWALTGDHRFEAGANRTGRISTWATIASLLALSATLASVWGRALRRPGSDAAGVPSLGAVAALLVFAPVLSPQYVSWLLPWAAVAGEEDTFWPRAAAVPLVLTGVAVSGWFLDLGLGAGRDQLILFARNLSLVALVMASVVRDTAPGILTRRARVVRASQEPT